MLSHPIPAHRPTVLYALAGLSAHDELVLKSMIRLLGSRAPHNWTYDTLAPQVLFLGRESPGQDMAMTFRVSASRVVYVGTQSAGRVATLEVPLNPNKLEDLLKSMGQQVAGNHDLAQAVNLANQTQVLQGHESHALSPNSLVSLKRWPSLALLNKDPVRQRVATLLVGKQLRLSHLHKLSGAEWADVLNFCVDAHDAGFLLVHSTGAVAVNPSTVQPAASGTAQRLPGPANHAVNKGLLGLIRDRLGLGGLFGKKASA